VAPTAASPSLAELAAQSFGDLAVGEAKLLEWLSAPWRPNSRLDLGYVLENASGAGESESEPPPRDCVIRAQLIEWLCREAQPRTLSARHGIMIDRAVIAGRLVLSFTDVPFPVAFFRCELAGGIELTNANLVTIGLDGCRVAEIQAASVSVRGSVFLRRGFRCQAGASFVNATIAGDLSCDGAAFERTDGFGLDLDRATISRSVFLRNGFQAPGGVRLKI
jgi:hypothetical protein